MKTKHTSEDWKAYGYEVRQPGGRMIAEFGPQHTPPGEYPDSCRLEDEANAQRAVACVNACGGMDDPAIEISCLRSRSDGVPAMCAEVESLRTQRDELKRALEIILARVESGEGMGPKYYGGPPLPIRDARSAIAKATT